MRKRQREKSSTGWKENNGELRKLSGQGEREGAADSRSESSTSWNLLLMRAAEQSPPLHQGDELCRRVSNPSQAATLHRALHPT